MTPEDRQDLTALFRAQRGRLFAIAYRMLGTVSEAEDVVQEAFYRYGRIDSTEVEAPQAFLTTTSPGLPSTISSRRGCAASATFGSWLPEPLVSTEPGVDEQAETADSISMAFLVLLESLSALERAVFLLREAFDYDYESIGRIVGRSAENCRQIALRARGHVDAGRPRFDASRAERDALARRFFAACEDGDTEGLLELLSADTVLYGDGGGQAPAVRKPLHGRDRVARTLIGLLGRAAEIGARHEPIVVNGQPGARYLDSDGGIINVVALDIADGQIQAVRSVVNPDKLGHLGPTADLQALVARLRTRRR